MLSSPCTAHCLGTVQSKEIYASITEDNMMRRYKNTRVQELDGRWKDNVRLTSVLAPMYSAADSAAALTYMNNFRAFSDHNNLTARQRSTGQKCAEAHSVRFSNIG